MPSLLWPALASLGIKIKYHPGYSSWWSSLECDWLRSFQSTAFQMGDFIKSFSQNGGFQIQGKSNSFLGKTSMLTNSRLPPCWFGITDARGPQAYVEELALRLLGLELPVTWTDSGGGSVVGGLSRNSPRLAWYAGSNCISRNESTQQKSQETETLMNFYGFYGMFGVFELHSSLPLGKSKVWWTKWVWMGLIFFLEGEGANQTIQSGNSIGSS